MKEEKFVEGDRVAEEIDSSLVLLENRWNFNMRKKRINYLVQL